MTKANGTAKSVRKITTAYITRDGNIIKHDDLMRRGTKVEGSQEIPKQRGVNERFVDPPFSFDQLSSLLQRNTPHYRAIQAKAGDTASRGWFLEAVEGREGSDADKQRLMDFFNRPGIRGQSLSSIAKCFVVDYESLGNGSLEIVVDADGTPNQLNHIPVKTIRVSRDFQVYEHSRGRKETFFAAADLADGLQVNAKTGDVSTSVPFPNRANRLIYARKYHPDSDFYGIPDVIPAIGSVAGDLAARDFNLDFFSNGAIPDYMIVINGADLSEDVEKSIKDFYKHELKGSGNTHRTMILPIPFDDVEVKVEKLTPEFKDGSFRLYREANRDEVLSANGVPPLRAFINSPGSFGRDQSRELNKIYKESTIDPLQEMIEGVINWHVIRQGFSIEGWNLRFLDLAFEDRDLVSLIIERLEKTKIASKNEIRRVASSVVPGGLAPIDGGDDVPDTVSEPEKSSHACKAEAFIKAMLDPLADLPGRQGGEWDGAKSEEVKAIVRRLTPIVNKGEADLKKIFAAAEREVLKNLEAQKGAGLFGFFKQEKVVSVTSVLKDFDERVEIAVETTLIDIGGKSLEAGFLAAGNAVGTSLSFDIQRQATERFLETVTAPFSKNITKGISNRIRRELTKGIIAGETIPQMAERVKKVFASVNDSRALLIARTESARAHGVGTARGYRETGKVSGVKVIDGTDFDQACRSANGKTWSLDRAEANPIEHPNCVRGFSPVVGRP